jgi:hypothetical protein
VPYLLANTTTKVVTFGLQPTFDASGIPNWRVRQMTRNQTKWVKMPPNSTVDLCKPPYDLTEDQARAQPEILQLIRRGHLRQVVDEKLVEPKAPHVTAEDVTSLIPKTVPQETEQTPVVQPSSNTDIPVVPPPGEVKSHGDLLAKAQAVLKESSPASAATLPPEATTNPQGIAIPKKDCTNGGHDFSNGGCIGCGAPQANSCTCGYVAKNPQGLKAHQRSCKKQTAA